MRPRVEDLTHLNPKGALRPLRHRTVEVVVHNFGVEPLTPHGLIRFFTETADGVGTVTLNGSWSDKKPIIDSWKKTRIPRDNLERAFGPYHLTIDPWGGVAQILPWLARGAHAYGNSSSIGVALLGGPFHDQVPPPDQMQSLRKLLRWLLADANIQATLRVDNGLSIVGHDDVKARQHVPPKGCPGRAMLTIDEHGHRSGALLDVVRWAEGAAELIRLGPERR